MSDDHTDTAFSGNAEGSETEEADTFSTAWLLADHPLVRSACADVAEKADKQTLDTQVVNVSQVIGSVTRDALAGGAERILQSLRVAFGGTDSDAERLLGAMRRVRPDLVATTSPKYVRPLAMLESLTGVETLQVGILPDFNLTAQWLDGGLDILVVPHSKLMERAEAMGFEGGVIWLGGPLVSPDAFDAPGPEEAKRSFDLTGQPVVLVRASEFTKSELDKLLFQFSLVTADPEILFHHGGNKGIANALRSAAGRHEISASMFGRTKALEDIISAADAVVTSPADRYVSTIAYMKTPLVFVGHDSGKMGQVDFLVKHDGAVHIPEMLQVSGKLEAAIAPERLEQISQNLDELVRDEPNQTVADCLLAGIKERQRHSLPGSGTGTADPEADSGEASENAGPFEPIGTKEYRAKKRARPEDIDSSPDSTQTRDSARDDLAELILIQRDLERQLDSLAEDRQLWRERKQLAKQWGETELADRADERLSSIESDYRSLQNRLERVEQRKEKLKRSVSGSSETSSREEPVSRPQADTRAESGSRSDLEKRFRQMELDRDLNELKDRIRRELDGESE